MKNKKVKIAILVIAIILILAVVGLVTYEAYQKGVLLLESTKIGQLDITTDEIDMTIKTSGKYGKIEKAEKEYMKEMSDLFKETLKIFTNEDLMNSLSIDNYKKDGPEFTQTKQLLADSKVKAEELIASLTSKITEDSMMEKIKQVEGLKEKDYELYRNLMLDDETRKALETSKEELEGAKTTFLTNLQAIEDILNFLTENKTNWTLTDNNIMFSTTSLLNKYNELVRKLN